eukprot:6290028-Lingulodinium_polyedra.AAC.1
MQARLQCRQHTARCAYRTLCPRKRECSAQSLLGVFADANEAAPLRRLRCRLLRWSRTAFYG